MKNIREKLVRLLKTGYCTPQIGRLARALKEPPATLHYNIKKLEKEGVVKAYRATFDYKRIEEGFCVYVLLNLAPGEYSDPEKIAKKLAKFPQIESVDIVTGECELVVKMRTKDIDEYYQFVKNVLSMRGITRIVSLNSLKQMKTEFVEL